MYLIYKVGFDSAENTKYKEEIGVINDDEAVVLRWMEQHHASLDKHYQGYDGIIYPYYEKKFVKELSI